MINIRCMECKHYWGAWCCEAFLGKIPEDIQSGKNDHSNSVNGDHGLKFTERKQVNNMDPRAPELQMITPDPRPDSAYDPVQLEAGIKVEMEHTKNREVAKSIAKTHIDENRSYYKILDRVGL